MEFERLSEFGNNIALIDPIDRKSIKYTDLILMAKEVVADFSRGSLVFLSCQWTIGTISFYLGCLNKGVIVVFVPEDVSRNSMESLIRIYKPAAVVYPTKITYFDFLPEKNINPNLALLMGTSGSSASPKFVRITLNNLVKNAESIAESLALSSADRGISNLPLSYSYGLSILNMHLIRGGSMVLCKNSIFEKDFWRILREYSVTNLGGVPSTYELIDKYLQSSYSNDTPSLKFLTQAGGALKGSSLDKTIQNSRKLGAKFFKMYGQTEATARMTILPSDEIENNRDSVGYSIPGGRIQLLDAEGREVTALDTIGEVVYYGPNVSLGYAFSRSDIGAGDQNNGRLATGDLGFLDAFGSLHITGRKDRLVKINGMRIDLTALEDLLLEEKLSISIQVTGSKLQIFLERRKWDAKLKNHVAQKIGIKKYLLEFYHVDSFPLLESGKLDSQSLIQLTKLKRSHVG